jgi:hypothetical protein
MGHIPGASAHPARSVAEGRYLKTAYFPWFVFAMKIVSFFTIVRGLSHYCSDNFTKGLRDEVQSYFFAHSVSYTRCSIDLHKMS